MAPTVGLASEFEVNTTIDIRSESAFAVSMLGSAMGGMVVSWGVFNVFLPP
jgi:hypothetical protein